MNISLLNFLFKLYKYEIIFFSEKNIIKEKI